jgi:apurinic endonuclease APN1
MTYLCDSFTINNLDYLSKLQCLDGFQFGINPDVIGSKIPVLTQQHIDSLSDKTIILHGKYVYNFCRPNVINQIDSLVAEVNMATQLKCPVVIHQGKNVERISKLHAINNYVKNLSDVIDQTFNSDSMLLLENSAAQGTELGFSLDELTYIYNQFDDNIKHRIGFCLDTCHIFVAGQLDVRQQQSVVDFFQRFDRQIGLDKLKCVHFNDSGAPFGAKRDIHGDFLVGYISNPLLGGSSEGLVMVAKIATDHRIPLIFETPCLFPGQLSHAQIVTQWLAGDRPIDTSLNQRGLTYYTSPKTKKKKSTV